jgi:hypothetical protein
MRWLYFIIPLVGLAILITSLSLGYEQRLTLKEALELYIIYINISPADEAYGLCESINILNHEYLLHAIKDVDNQLAYLKALKKHDPSINLDSKDINSSLTITPLQAYELLRDIGINHVTKPIERFTCNIIHNDSYYKMEVQAMYHLIPDDEGYGMIKITEASYDNTKILTIEPKNLYLWVPFNNNLIFVNETDYKVRVTMFYNGQKHDSFSILPHSNVTRHIRIMDMIIGYVDHAVLTYYVSPYNMEGSIVMSRSPACMNEEQASILFGLVGVKMVFPRYLPEGYRYECTVHVMNTIARSYYSSEEGRRLYGEGMDYVNNANSESGKELTITIYKHTTSEKYNAREWYEYVKKNYDPNALLLTINNTEGVAYYDRLYSTNNIAVFYDDHTYRIEGRLNMDEIIKIAQSLD